MVFVLRSICENSAFPVIPREDNYSKINNTECLYSSLGYAF